MGTAQQPSRPVLVVALVFAMTFPAVMTWLYFLALAGTAGQLNLLQQIAYTAGKAVQFSFPILFVWLTSGRGEPPPSGGGAGSVSDGSGESPPSGGGAGSVSDGSGEPPPSGGGAGTVVGSRKATGVALGLGFGLLVVAFMFVVYFGFLRHSPVLANMPQKLQSKLEEFGVASPNAFLGLGVFIAAIHSLLEEYYWRWFVFGRLRELIPTWTAIGVSSLTFMAHHVIVLYAYLPGQFWYGVLPFSLGVAVGGAFWAWLYQRSGTLLGPWLSHLLVDAGIFVIGWDLLSRSAG